MEKQSLGAATLKTYPQEKCVMSSEKHSRFVEKCKSKKLPRSRVMNILIDMWLEGTVEIPSYERTAITG